MSLFSRTDLESRINEFLVLVVVELTFRDSNASRINEFLVLVAVELLCSLILFGEQRGSEEICRAIQSSLLSLELEHQDEILIYSSVELKQNGIIFFSTRTRCKTTEILVAEATRYSDRNRPSIAAHRCNYLV